MELSNVVFNEDTIVLEFTNVIVNPPVKIYVDSLNNRNNLTSGVDTDHDLTYTVINSNITIDRSEFDYNELVITFTFVDTTNSVQYFRYDEKQLYLTIKKFLIKYCSTCLDNEQKDRILMYYFKKDLFDYSMVYGTFEEQVSYYTDLLRMVGGKGYKNFSIKSNYKQGCKSCINGVCAIC